VAPVFSDSDRELARLSFISSARTYCAAPTISTPSGAGTVATNAKSSPVAGALRVGGWRHRVASCSA
jgi:hypothetical protein